ncbi:MAG TPA: tetratricopeptide repeat protein [Methanothrix sp.]|nr:tetratricopeptide repeat protein [Methanothrix sp.]
MSGDIKTGEAVKNMKRNQAAILLIIFLLIATAALATYLYFNPEIKNNPLFIALGFIATVFPCLYLVRQILKEQRLRRNPDGDPSPHQIPQPPNDFIGREDDIRQILARFDQGATINSLRGMGGVGKTVLAYVLASRLKDRFPDGQLFLNMEGTSKSPLKPEDAMAHIIRSYLGADASLPEDLNGLNGLYQTVLSGKNALILLDNAADGDQVGPLLPPKGCALLVTSRNKFALPGLTGKDLDVLPLDDAKNLLLEICERIADHAGDLAELCGRLPIALRNAASTLREKPNLSVANYIKRLGDIRDRLELVEASFSLSYDLLTSDLQRLWSLLSIFPDDFDLAGAAAVWAMEETPTEDALGELIRWSLVDFLPSATGEGGRYRLHDLARDFAGSRLDAASREPARLHHAEHYRDVLNQASEIFNQGKDPLKGLELLDQERANILSGQSWASKNLDGSSSAAIDLCKSYPDAGVYVLDLRLSPREKIHWLETALQASRKSDDRAAEGSHLGNLGRAYSDLSDPRKAINYYEEALSIFREIGDRQGKGTVLLHLGRAFSDLGDPRKAINYCEEALSIFREIGDRRGEGADLGSLGRAYSILGDPRKAIEFHKKALAISREIGAPQGEGSQLANMGIAYSDLGDPQKAIEFHEKALAISQEIGDLRGEGDNLSNLGVAYSDLGDPRKAIEFYEKALSIYRETGDRRGERNDLGNLGNAYFNLGDPQKAIEFYEKALAISSEIGDRHREGTSLGNLGAAYFNLGDPRKAIEFYEQALSISREIGDSRGEGDNLFNMSHSLRALGQNEEAVSLARSALAIYEEIESPYAETVRKTLAEWGG